MKKPLNMFRCVKNIIVLCLSYIIIFTTTPVLASPNLPQSNPECDPIDLVILLDQSNAMDQVDPENLRLTYVSNLISMMGLEHMAACQNTPHAISVITFGGGYPLRDKEVHVDITMQELEPSKSEGILAWQSQVSSLSEQITTGEGLYGRSFNEAFEYAVGELENGRNSKKMILLISAYYGSPKNESIKYPGNALNELQSLANDLDDLTRYLDDVSIYVIGIEPENPDSAAVQYKDKIIPEWKSITRRFNGSFELVLGTDISQIAQEAVSMIGEVSSSFENTFQSGQCGSFYVNPLVEESVTYLFANAQDTDISIKSTETDLKTDLTPKNSSEAFFHLETDPIPGEWTMDGACLDFWFFNTSSYYLVDAVVEPTDSSSQPQCDPSKYQCASPTLKIKLLDPEGSDIPIFPNALPKIEANSSVIPGLTFQYNDEGWFQSIQDIPTHDANQVTWNIDVSAPSLFPTGGSDVPLYNLEGTFFVSPVTPINLKIIEPEAGSRNQLYSSIFSGLTPRDIKVKIRITDEFGARVLDLNGREINTDEFFEDSFENDIKVILTNNETLEATEAYFSLSQSENQVLEASIGTELLEKGEYSVLVLYQNEKISNLNDQFQLLDSPEGRQIEIRRACGLFYCPTTVSVLTYTGIALLVLLLAGAIFLLSRRTKGALEFSVSGYQGFYPIGTVAIKPPLRYFWIGNKTLFGESPILGFIQNIIGNNTPFGEINLRFRFQDSQSESMVNIRETLGTSEDWVSLSRGVHVRYQSDVVLDSYLDDQLDDLPEDNWDEETVVETDLEDSTLDNPTEILDEDDTAEEADVEEDISSKLDDDSHTDDLADIEN